MHGLCGLPHLESLGIFASYKNMIQAGSLAGLSVKALVSLHWCPSDEP